jgi:hypothetical protein
VARLSIFVFTAGAAALFVVAGLKMTSLRSESGNTIAELFDQAMGLFSYGMAALTVLGGIAADRLFAISVRDLPVDNADS